MAQLVGRANPVPEVVGSIPYPFHIFARKKQITEIFRYHTISHEKVRENCGKKKPKCLGQLPLGTGSQRHIAEQFKETWNSDSGKRDATRKFRVVSRFHRYISSYISENRFPSGQHADAPLLELSPLQACLSSLQVRFKASNPLVQSPVGAKATVWGFLGVNSRQLGVEGPEEEPTVSSTLGGHCSSVPTNGRPGRDCWCVKFQPIAALPAKKKMALGFTHVTQSRKYVV